VEAYTDTIEVFFPYRPKGLMKQIRAMTRQAVWFAPCIDPLGNVRGYRLIVHQPNIPTLRTLDEWQSAHHGRLCRLDIAFDFTPRPHVDPQELIEWIERHVMLRWRRPGNMLDIEQTLYWIEQRGRNKRSSRDAALYTDRHSKLTGELDCIHLELRLQNASTIRKEDIAIASDIITLDPRLLFYKHIRLVTFPAKEIKKRYVRNTVKHDRLTYRSKQTSAFTDRYRSSIHRYANARWERAQFDRVQNYRDFNPDHAMKMKTLPLFTLNVADRLSWCGSNGDALNDKGNLGMGGEHV
jgi:hypothetical protein